MIYLPKGSPYLNAMKECWHQGKRVLLVSEYYKTFQDMHRVVSLYYRTVRFKLDILKFTSKKYMALQRLLIFSIYDKEQYSYERHFQR